MAWALVQTANGIGSNLGTSFSLAWTTTNITTNNRILLATSVWVNGGITITSVTDSAGNAYNLVKRVTQADATDTTIWEAVITAGGGTKPTVTVNGSGSAGEWSIAMAEYSGLSTVAGSSAYDGTAGSTAGTGNASSGATTPAPTASNELAFGSYGDGGNLTTISAGTGWTNFVSTGPQSATSESAIEDQNSTSGTGSNATFTLSPTGSPWAAIAVIMQLAAAPAAPAGFAYTVPVHVGARRGPIAARRFNTRFVQTIFPGVSGPQSLTSTINATLSFTGAQTRAITKGLPAAALSFTSAQTRAIGTGLTAALSFTGAQIRAIASTSNTKATLTFTSSQTHAISKGITAALSFTSAQTRAITKGLSGVLSFTSAQTRAITKGAFAASLSFTGSVVSSKIFFRTLTATLSFTSSQSRAITKLVAAGLSFTSSQVRAITHGLTAALSFTSAQTRAITKSTFTAALSFTGSVAKRWQHTASATLSFTSSQTRAVGKVVAAGLSFTSSQVRAVTKGLTATLSFTGANTRAITKTAFAAALSFTGSAVKQTQKALSASLSFAGSWANSFSGAHVVIFNAALSFTSSSRNAIRKGIFGNLSFTGLEVPAPFHVSVAALFQVQKRIFAFVEQSRAFKFIDQGRLFKFSAQKRALAFSTEKRQFTFKVVQRTVSMIDLQPSSFDISTKESAPINIDCTNYLAGGDSVTLPAVEVRNNANVVVSGAASAPSVSGNIIQTTLTGSALLPNQTYTLLVTFTASAGKVLTGKLTVNCII